MFAGLHPIKKAQPCIEITSLSPYIWRRFGGMSVSKLMAWIISVFLLFLLLSLICIHELGKMGYDFGGGFKMNKFFFTPIKSGFKIRTVLRTITFLSVIQAI